MQAAVAQQPTAVTNAGYYSAYANPVRFVRASGTYMTSGQDSIDLGIAGPFAAYITMRPYNPAQMTLAARGAWDAVCRTPAACSGWAMVLSNSALAPSPGAIGMRLVDGIGVTAGAMIANAPNYYSLTYSTMVAPDASGAGMRFNPTYLALPAGTNWSLVTTCVNSTVRYNCSNITFVTTCANATTRLNCTNTTLETTSRCTNTTSVCRTANVTVNLTTPWVFRPQGFGSAVVGSFRSFGVNTFTPNFPTAQATANNLSAPVATTWGNFPNPMTPGIPITTTLNFKIGGQDVIGGDPNRGFDGEIHGMLTYRESHSQAVRQQVERWTELNFYTTCQSIAGPTASTNNQGGCGYTYRETYCTQTCKTGYTTVAGYPYNW